ncbi:MAG TPA: cupin domain-containing protein [Burkholderiales bacterium]|nr:cupin domain-containing protein [Burkholderiales bacterium]
MKNNVSSTPGNESRNYRFIVSRSKGAAFETDGLREEFAYRDLGLADATCGEFHAHIIKAKHLDGGHNGLHRHHIDLQFLLVLKGWVRFAYVEQGEVRYEQGDAVTIPGNTLHELLDYSEDLELLELTSPAVYRTVRQDGTEMPTPGQKVRIEERTSRAK